MFEKGNKIGHRFKPGQSGNPTGRAKIIGEIQELARAHTPSAIKTLVGIMENEQSPPAARVAAAAHLLDRAYGRPPQGLEHSGNVGLTLEQLIRSSYQLGDDARQITDDTKPH
jgi:Family of unknown function (DUF5681)